MFMIFATESGFEMIYINCYDKTSEYLQSLSCQVRIFDESYTSESPIALLPDSSRVLLEITDEHVVEIPDFLRIFYIIVSTRQR